MRKDKIAIRKGERWMLQQIHFPWIMHQSWGKMLFAHWPVSGQHLRDLVSPLLQIDTFAKQAWH
jgi:uncharacterized protein YqjF (DUF2071 family)